MYVPTASAFVFVVFLFQRHYLNKLVSKRGDPEEFRNTPAAELYLCAVVKKLDEVNNKEKALDLTHLNSFISLHMEECKRAECVCKNYEPDFHSKFTTDIPSRCN